MRASALALGAYAGVPALSAQAAATRVLRRGVGVTLGPGGAIGWLATSDGALAVDSQFPETARTCIAALLARAPAGIEVLINTHHHADHTAGNVAFRPVVGRIVQHDQCARLHRAAVDAAVQGAVDVAAGAARSGLADVTFADGWSTTIGDERVTATHYGPAHTSGDAAVFFERANVVHAGDLVFNRIPPFVDRAAGASIEHWIVVLETVAARHADALFIFGHGKADAVTGSAADVLYFRDYLTAVLAHARRAIADGRSQEETTSLASLPGFPEHLDLVKNYASAFPLFTLGHVLTAAYQELTAR